MNREPFHSQTQMSDLQIDLSMLLSKILRNASRQMYHQSSFVALEEGVLSQFYPAALAISQTTVPSHLLLGTTSGFDIRPVYSLPHIPLYKSHAPATLSSWLQPSLPNRRNLSHYILEISRQHFILL